MRVERFEIVKRLYGDMVLSRKMSPIGIDEWDTRKDDFQMRWLHQKTI